MISQFVVAAVRRHAQVANESASDPKPVAVFKGGNDSGHGVTLFQEGAIRTEFVQPTLTAFVGAVGDAAHGIAIGTRPAIRQQ